MHTLDKVLRSSLENTIIEARASAEATARIVLEQLGVGEKVPYPHLTEDERKLRNKLRLHGRQLGDASNDDKTQSIDNLIEEVAYQHWHRMLFSRFLAENNLLMDDDPVSPISMSLDECNDMASSLGAKSGWDLAARYASHMLPQIFKIDSPVFSLTFPIEHQKALEKLVSDIPLEVFQASDSLGWVYQFWQTQRKKAINDSGVKIGARELPAVTQLFTEPYMVSFLLDNSLGAWWASRRLSEHDLSTAESEQELRGKASLSGMPLEYLRFVKDDQGKWTPAGGTFDAWPKSLSEFKMLDPCCGSGHFLVATLGMLVPIRMELEDLTEDEAIKRVLSENIHGLELDQRCVELAAFALAFAAWTYPGSKGYIELPELHIACSGQAIHISDEELIKLSNGNHELYNALDDLKNKFQQAPILGSLIDPKSSIHQNELFSLDWEEVGPLLDSVLRKGQDDDLDEAGIVAQGLAKAASLLAGTYHLVATNVPYLARGKQDQVLKDYCERYHNEAKNDLATVFLDRCLQFCPKGGTTSVVLPQNWLFLTSYASFRRTLLKEETWHLIARLGPGAFDTISGEVVKAILILISRERSESEQIISGVDVSEQKAVEEKAKKLIEREIKKVVQKKQLKNPDSRVVMEEMASVKLLGSFADAPQGIKTGDDNYYREFFWELLAFNSSWCFYQSTPDGIQSYSGMSYMLRWIDDGKTLARKQGSLAWGKKGLSISQMSNLSSSLYNGAIQDSNINVLISKSGTPIEALKSYVDSPYFIKNVRLIDQKLSVTNATMLKVPFDLERWTKVAEEKYPHGLPLPFSDDPAQWIFHGHPCKSVVWDDDTKWTTHGFIRYDSSVLHIAVARLLGYRWPAELDPKMELAKEQRALVNECEALLPIADKDGIVCIPSVGGEFSAADRLLKILKTSYGDAWTDDTLSILLKNTDAPGKTLEAWLRDKFFLQHCKLFGDRPFIWQIWDGLPDGFSALVNYHKLDYKNLETLTYTYLGDWILRQKSDVSNSVEGSRERLAAAMALSKSLELILKGDAPYDIFVRWKSLEEQPIGWIPDLNDGVRLNIRPFMSVPDVGKREAGILRDKPNVKWGKDRGKDVESAPWYNLGPLYGGKKGDRINDHHLTLDEKLDARRARGN